MNLDPANSMRTDFLMLQIEYGSLNVNGNFNLL